MKIVAIDPGLRGSGIAIWKDDKFEKLCKMELWELYELISSDSEAFYLVEDSNIGKNWHGPTSRANVGKNQAVSTLIIEYLKKMNRGFRQLPPSGYSTRYTDAKGNYCKFSRKVFESETGWKGASNKDSRAAAAMVASNKHLVKALIKEKG